MAKSIRTGIRNKPSKPHPDYPLFPHQNGQFAKKVKGRVYYFGRSDDADAALAEWLIHKDFILSTGEKKPVDADDAVTIKLLADTFLTAKRRRVDSGELSPHTFRDYFVICQAIADHFGKHRSVSTVRPADFAELRATFAKSHGAYRLAKDVRVTMMLFKFGMDNDLISHVIKYGSEFKEPDKKTKRKAKAASGKKIFDSDETRRIIDASPVTLKAMVLLAVNCGLGNTDVSELRTSNVERGWLDFPRIKTGLDRRCPLWPETIAAMDDAAKIRPAAKDTADDNRVFITKYGRPWVRLNEHEDTEKRTRVDSIAQELRKVLKKLDIKSRRGFYSFRHSHRTASAEARDKQASDFIMGHSDGSMASEYTHGISDARLIDVVNVVRTWLWPDAVAGDNSAISK